MILLNYHDICSTLFIRRLLQKSFGHLVGKAQRSPCRADVRTASAFHTLHDFKSLQPFHILVFISFDHRYRHKTERTGFDTHTALDAAALFSDQRLRPVKYQYCILVFYNRKSIRINGSSHHRSAHQDLLRLCLVASACSDYVTDPRPDRYDYILWLCYRIAVYCDSLCRQRSACLEVLTYERYGRDIGKQDAES